MRMSHKPENTEIVTPSPYFNITFRVSNRRFYEVKSELYSIAENIGIEIQDGYISEHCDYEGDLEEIRIYNCERGKPLIDATLEFYGVDKEDLPEGMTLTLSIF